ncbi:MAG: hypothetical protein J0L81_13905 [Caulobacterales bacterium]|nr:hypothetical protein [Caulobacterales bacterium]
MKLPLYLSAGVATQLVAIGAATIVGLTVQPFGWLVACAALVTLVLGELLTSSLLPRTWSWRVASSIVISILSYPSVTGSSSFARAFLSGDQLPMWLNTTSSLIAVSTLPIVCSSFLHAASWLILVKKQTT